MVIRFFWLELTMTQKGKIRSTIPVSLKNGWNKRRTVESTFLDCYKVASKNVGSKAFKGIHAKATIKVPKSKLKNYKKLLKARGVGKKAKIKK